MPCTFSASCSGRYFLTVYSEDPVETGKVGQGPAPKLQSKPPDLKSINWLNRVRRCGATFAHGALTALAAGRTAASCAASSTRAAHCYATATRPVPRAVAPRAPFVVPQQFSKLTHAVLPLCRFAAQHTFIAFNSQQPQQQQRSIAHGDHNGDHDHSGAGRREEDYHCADHH